MTLRIWVKICDFICQCGATNIAGSTVKFNFQEKRTVARWKFTNNDSTLHSFSFKTGLNVSIMNVSCPQLVIKQSVQNVHELQQHTIEVCCELTRLPLSVNSCGKSAYRYLHEASQLNPSHRPDGKSSSTCSSSSFCQDNSLLSL